MCARAHALSICLFLNVFIGHSVIYICVCIYLFIYCNSFSLLNFQVRVPYRPIEAKLRTLPTDRDKLPSGKQILALTLTLVQC